MSPAFAAVDAAKAGDIVVVTVPLKSYRQVPVEPLAGKVVIDTNNYYPQRDGHIQELDNESTTTSELLLALPAGALGDIFDRRKLILTTEVWMFSVAVVLAILTLLHLITPWALLLLTLALSIGDALEAPTWRAVLPEMVPQEGLMPAIALNGIEFNLARAIGPALCGFLIASLGIAAVFSLNA